MNTSKLIETPGAVLLFRKENTQGIYTFLESLVQRFVEAKIKDNFLAKFISDIVAKLALEYISGIFNHKYIHAELVARNGWMFAAWFDGVNLYSPSDEDIIKLRKLTDVYIPKVPIDPDKLDKAIAKYFNKEYDFASLIQNAITKIFAFGNKKTEREIEDSLRKYFDTENRLICSELIARVYEELGYTIERHSEFTTPDDIAQSGLFQTVQF